MDQGNMNNDTFDYKSNDSQGTLVEPVEPEKFDLGRFADYEGGLLEGNRRFWNAEEGVQVYRRFRVLEMIDYFLEKTKGRVPLSLTDTQSPYNVASYLIETNSFYMSVFDCPDELKQLLERIARLSIEFTRKQRELIGDALASPGHGFASSREFDGAGMSSDNMMMLSPEQYRDVDVPSVELFGNAGDGEFGGPVFHSCGNWTDKIEAVKKIENLRMVDGAFSKETDPDANPPEPFPKQFAETGIVVNARIVGNEEKVTHMVKRLWREGMKLIVVTYCSSPEEQMSVYNRIHSECEE